MELISCEPILKPEAKLRLGRQGEHKSTEFVQWSTKGDEK